MRSPVETLAPAAIPHQPRPRRPRLRPLPDFVSPDLIAPTSPQLKSRARLLCSCRRYWRHNTVHYQRRLPSKAINPQFDNPYSASFISDIRVQSHTSSFVRVLMLYAPISSFASSAWLQSAGYLPVVHNLRFSLRSASLTVARSWLVSLE